MNAKDFVKFASGALVAVSLSAVGCGGDGKSDGGTGGSAGSAGSGTGGTGGGTGGTGGGTGGTGGGTGGTGGGTGGAGGAATGGAGGATGGAGGAMGGAGGAMGGAGGAMGGAGGMGGSLPTGQIDRAGRPAVASALISSGNRNNYNAAPEAMWPTFAGEIETFLEVIDNLDGTADNELSAALTITRAQLAGLLANDKLQIDISVADCTDGYLSLETGGAVGPNTCGGRTLAQDVIDLTLQGLVQFPAAGVTVSDDVDMNDAAFSTTFPYLAAPN